MTATTVRSTTGAPSSGPQTGRPADGHMIDPRGMRFGGGLSVVILAAGFLLGQPLVIPLVAFALGVSALFGTRWSVLGRPWPLVRRALRIGPPAELEHEYPPRFAQAMGSVGLFVATLLLVADLSIAGWLVAAAVAGLQTVLAVTGYCLGCRLYFLKWWVPAQFQRLARRTTLA